MPAIISKLFLLVLVSIVFRTIPLSAQEKEHRVTGMYYGLSLENVIKEIVKGKGLELDYEPAWLPAGIHPGNSFRDQPLAECLDILLKDQNLYFRIAFGKIFIRPNGVEIDYVPPTTLPPGTYTNYTLRGSVKDAQSGETLPYAQVLVDGTLNGTTTNTDGYFTLFTVPTDTSKLLVSYVGYVTKLIRMTPDLVKQDLVVELEASTTEISEVVISGHQEELMRISNRTGLISLAPSKIAELPSIGEKDIFRSFQLLPGISGSQESSSGLYIRGGTPDQNLVLYDGFTVYHVDHLFGMFSAFNADAIKDVKLSKGGFESKYGGRLSSVMEITGKDGNENGFDAGGNIGLISANAYMEVPFAKKGSILLSGRRSFQTSLYTKIFDQFQANTETAVTPIPTGKQMNRFMGESNPSSYFYDLNGKITYHPGKEQTLSLSFYHGQDVLDNSNEFNFSGRGMSMSGGRTDITDWGNWGTSLKWSKRWSEKWYTYLLGSYSNYFSTRDISSQNSFVRSGEDEARNTGIYENNGLYDYSIKQATEWKINKNNQVEFGVHGSWYQTNFLYTRNDTISIQDKTSSGFMLAGYLQDKVTLFGRLTLTPGIRTTFYEPTAKFYHEPRFSSVLSLSDKLKLTASWGQYYQFTTRIIRDDLESGSRDFWMLADGDLIPVSKSTHYIGGISWENRNLLFGIDAFYKEMSGLTEYTLQYVPAYREINYDEFFYQGSGTSRGVEFLAQKKAGAWNGWLSYTYQQVVHEFDVYGDNRYYASHDIPHELKLVNTFHYKNWNFSAVWIYGTGKPFTAPLGAYEVLLPDGTTRDYISIGNKNSNRLPDYHRLDLSAQLKIKMGDFGSGVLGFSLFNAYNRKNVWYKQYEIVGGQLIETDVNLLGITPNISFSINLH
jgi:ferric enterobactin receptor